MTGREAYRIWAPAGQRWSGWVRPVPFLAAKTASRAYLNLPAVVPAADYIDEAWTGAAIIVDLPGAESVRVGIALAKVGYRPIPIYNGTVEQQDARATTDNQSVGKALIMNAKELARIKISPDALPAFLTDRGRRNRFRRDPSLFDNSWDVYPQDLPSAEYFQKNKIRKIIVIGDEMAGDLKKILYGFQKKNMEIFLAERYGTPKKVMLHRPIRWKKD